MAHLSLSFSPVYRSADTMSWPTWTLSFSPVYRSADTMSWPTWSLSFSPVYRSADTMSWPTWTLSFSPVYRSADTMSWSTCVQVCQHNVMAHLVTVILTCVQVRRPLPSYTCALHSTQLRSNQLHLSYCLDRDHLHTWRLGELFFLLLLCSSPELLEIYAFVTIVHLSQEHL